MYQVQYFRARRAAAALAEGTFYILSAKYGLLPPGKMIAHATLTAGAGRPMWSARVTSSTEHGYRD